MNTEKTTKRNHQNKTRRAEENAFPAKKRTARLTPVGARGNFRQQLRSYAMTGLLLMFAGSAIGCVAVDPETGKPVERGVPNGRFTQVELEQRTRNAEDMCIGAGMELESVSVERRDFKFSCRAKQAHDPR